jgi:tRNA pseudouridine55 synthase
VPSEPLHLPVGEVRQRPPAHSAVKVEGERAYRRARRGEAVEMPERTVTVHRFDLLSREGDRAEFEIECSSGTYVRSLIADLGDAYCAELRRTAIGPFRVEDADPDRLVPLADALAFLPERRLEGDEAGRALHGVAVPGGGVAGAHVRLTDADGLIAVAEPRPDGTLKPTVGFRGS